MNMEAGTSTSVGMRDGIIQKT